MEALGTAASIVGIVSLGLQLYQIVQVQLDDVRHADESLFQLVEQIRGTAHSLSQLREIILSDEESPSDRILGDEGYKELARIVSRCEVVYRNIVVLVAKAGRTALAAVDDFQRNLKKDPANQMRTLDIEVSAFEHLMFPLRKSRITKLTTDLDSLRLQLILMLCTANLGKSRARHIR